MHAGLHAHVVGGAADPRRRTDDHVAGLCLDHQRAAELAPRRALQWIEHERGRVQLPALREVTGTDAERLLEQVVAEVTPHVRGVIGEP